MNRVVITGPTGAIGIALINKMIEKNIEVLAICRKNSNRIERIPKHPLVRVIECDLSELAVLEIDEIDEKPYDVFYHFAWAATIGDGRNDMQLQLRNVAYALDAVHLAKRLHCHTFIGAGSQAEYGRVEGKLKDTTPTFPENGYGMAKLCAGQMTRVECQKLGIRHIWTRVLSVYGPYDGESTMISSTIKKLLQGEKPSLTKSEQQWDYLYSADAANAMFLLGEKGLDGEIYCIGSGNVASLRSYVEIMRDCIHPDLPLGFGEVPYSDKQVMYLCADIEKLTRDTGFVPAVDFAEGIQYTIDWMRSL